MIRPRSRYMQLRQRIVKILTATCGHCDFDEAEGGLLNHCDRCCRKIVRELVAVIFGGKKVR